MHPIEASFALHPVPFYESEVARKGSRDVASEFAMDDGSLQRRCELLRHASARMGPLPAASCVDVKSFDWCSARRSLCRTGGSNYTAFIHERCARMCGACNSSSAQLKWEQHHESTRRTCGKVSSPPRCTHFYVDTGANTGDSLVSWYEHPSCFHAGVRFPIYMRQAPPCYYLWPPWLQIESRRQYCAVAFEPNPRHWDSLQRTASKMLSSFGSNVTLSNSAFSNQSAVASFGIDTIHGGSVGSSLELQRHTTDVHGKKGQGPTLTDQNSLIRVRTVDAAAFLDGLGDATSRNIVLKYVAPAHC